MKTNDIKVKVIRKCILPVGNLAIVREAGAGHYLIIKAQTHKGEVNVEARKRDLIIRIADWTRDRDEPAYDVEVYTKGNYSGGKTFTTKSSGQTKAQAKAAAIAYAQQQIAQL